MIALPPILSLGILWWHGRHPVACWVVAGSWILTWLVSKTVLTARADFQSSKTEQAQRVLAFWVNIFSMLYWANLVVCVVAVTATLLA